MKRGERMNWTPAERELVSARWLAGRSPIEIARELTAKGRKISGRAVSIYARKLGLPERVNPHVPPPKPSAGHAHRFISGAQPPKARSAPHRARGPRVGLIEPEFDSDFIEPLGDRVRRR